VGQLSHFDLTGLAVRYSLRTFVETGTGRGDSLAYACRFSPPLIRLHSCEVHPVLAAAAQTRFAGNPLVQVHSLRSTAFLDRLLPNLLRPLAASRDVILIDDARIWLDLPFGSGPIPDSLRPLCPAGRDIAFVQDLFNDTHDIHVDLSHEGYVMLTPREPPSAIGRAKPVLAAEVV
jgi:hypothetical protein